MTAPTYRLEIKHCSTGRVLAKELIFVQPLKNRAWVGQMAAAKETFVKKHAALFAKNNDLLVGHVPIYEGHDQPRKFTDFF